MPERTTPAHAHLLAAWTAYAERRHAGAADHAGQALGFCQAARATFYADQATELLEGTT
jgi:hypothetical protein